VFRHSCHNLETGAVEAFEGSAAVQHRWCSMLSSWSRRPVYTFMSILELLCLQRAAKAGAQLSFCTTGITWVNFILGRFHNHLYSTRVRASNVGYNL
jgi:hypothetical protein